MALRRMHGGLRLAVLALCAWIACGDDKHDDKAAAKRAPAKSAPAKPTADPGAALATRCESLSRACGDTDKHIAKILDECTATATQAGERCAAEVAALYGCYETQLCGKGDHVWTLDDLRVLAERNGACSAEREALRGCAAK